MREMVIVLVLTVFSVWVLSTPVMRGVAMDFEGDLRLEMVDLVLVWWLFWRSTDLSGFWLKNAEFEFRTCVVEGFGLMSLMECLMCCWSERGSQLQAEGVRKPRKPPLPKTSRGFENPENPLCRRRRQAHRRIQRPRRHSRRLGQRRNMEKWGNGNLETPWEEIT
ncbi:hypothetical protein Sjap_001011 [Stephania japonica]|uniref:Uncharacterized protein n=1 Tax=Stephania japonica TaxID=461633 RepID=A0AAP0KJ65_9MAGN